MKKLYALAALGLAFAATGLFALFVAVFHPSRHAGQPYLLL